MNQDNNVVYPQQPVQAPQKDTNVCAILGLVFAFLCAPLGLIFSIIGWAKSKKCNSGLGLSIAGFVISLLSVVLFGVVIFLFATVMKTDAFKDEYCIEIEPDKDTTCTLLSDGTYDCIFAICDFRDDVVYEKEEETNESIVESKKEVKGKNYTVNGNKVVISDDTIYVNGKSIDNSLYPELITEDTVVETMGYKYFVVKTAYPSDYVHFALFSSDGKLVKTDRVYSFSVEGNTLKYYKGQCEGTRTDGTTGMTEDYYEFSLDTLEETFIRTADHDAGWAC